MLEARSLDVTSKPKRPLGAFEVQVINAGDEVKNPVTGELEPPLDDKARIYPGTGVIQVNGEWWRKLSNLEQKAVLLHEQAHDEDPRNNNEGDMDERAGAMLRHEGVSRAAAVAAFAAVVEGRRTSHTVGRGWDLADAAIRGGRALEGECPCPCCSSKRSLEEDGFSSGLPDVDGTSFADTQQLIELGAIPADLGPKPPKQGVRAPAGTAPKVPEGPLSFKRELVIPVVVAVVAAIAVYVVTRGKA